MLAFQTSSIFDPPFTEYGTIAHNIVSNFVSECPITHWAFPGQLPIHPLWNAVLEIPASTFRVVTSPPSQDSSTELQCSLPPSTSFRRNSLSTSPNFYLLIQPTHSLSHVGPSISLLEHGISIYWRTKICSRNAASSSMVKREEIYDNNWRLGTRLCEF